MRTILPVNLDFVPLLVSCIATDHDLNQTKGLLRLPSIVSEGGQQRKIQRHVPEIRDRLIYELDVVLIVNATFVRFFFGLEFISVISTKIYGTRGPSYLTNLEPQFLSPGTSVGLGCCQTNQFRRPC